jgi:hypothetical protein
MEESKQMTTILAVLNDEWNNFIKMLSDEQIDYLKLEIGELRRNLEKSEKNEDTANAARTFIEAFNHIEPLSFLTRIEGAHMRSGSLPEREEEIKIKLLNYCAIIRGKIEAEQKNEDL